MKQQSNTKTVSDIALALAMSKAGVGSRNHQLKTEMAKWVISQAKKMKNPWSVNLTYRFPIAGGAPKKRELASMETSLRKHFTSLVHALSRMAYGKAYKRHKKLIDAFGFFELGENDRFHIHAIFDIPLHADPSKSYDAKFKKDLNLFWGRHGMVICANEVTGDKSRNQSKDSALEALCLYIVKLRTKYTESGSYTDSLLLID